MGISNEKRCKETYVHLVAYKNNNKLKNNKHETVTYILKFRLLSLEL